MKVGLNTSDHYIEAKTKAVQNALEKIGIKAEVNRINPSDFPYVPKQAFGFEELIQRARWYAQEALKIQGVDLGVGIESSLSFIYSADEWYYVICVAVETKIGNTATSFTPGISVPQWMVKELQQDDTVKKLDVLIERMTGGVDPVAYFSEYTLTRKELMVPTVLLAISQLSMEIKSQNK